nr:hypothetical protein [Paenibacillus sp. S150]
MILSDAALSMDGATEFITRFFTAIMDAVNPEANRQEYLIYKEFIDTHYHEDIHLEPLADKFHTTSNYMSRLLKKSWGVRFTSIYKNCGLERRKNCWPGRACRFRTSGLRSGSITGIPLSGRSESWKESLRPITAANILNRQLLQNSLNSSFNDSLPVINPTCANKDDSQPLSAGREVILAALSILIQHKSPLP